MAGVSVRWYRAQTSRGGLSIRPRPPESGVDGSFEIDALLPGDYELYATRRRYRDAALGGLVVESDGTTEARIEMPRVEEVLPLDVRVEDHRGLPVPEARVDPFLQVNPSPTRLRAPAPTFTGADGRGLFDRAPVGSYSIRADADWLRQQTGSHGPFRLGSDIPPYSVRMRPRPPTAPLSGRLVGPDGGGISGAVVETRWEGRGSPDRFQAITEADGRFRFDAVPQGRHLLKATREGMPGILLRRVLDVGPAGLDGLEVGVPVAGSVVGSVVGGSPDGPEDVWVRATSTHSAGDVFQQYVQSAGRTDSSGRFRLDGLTPGEWRLEARNDDGREATRSITIEEPGQQVATTLELPRGFTLTGRILWRGVPGRSPGMSLSHTESRDRRVAAVDRDARYVVEDLRPGRYRLRVNLRELRSPFFETVELDGEARLDVHVRGGAVRGRVVDAGTGEPIAGADLRTDPLPAGSLGFDTFEQFHATDRDGRFAVGPFTAGSWKFEVTAPGYARREPVVEIGDEDIDDLVVELSRSPGLALRLRTPTPHRPEALGLVWQDLATGERYRISLFPRNAGTLEFQWDGIPLGRGILTASVSAGLAHRSVVTNEGERIEVPLEDAGRLEVRVAALEDPSVSATMRVFDADDVAVPSRFGGVEWRPRDGEFVVRALVPGTYRLEVAAEDGRVWRGEVEIRPLEVVEVVLR